MSERVGRTEYWVRDGIRVTYTDTDICFEEIDTADAILIKNDKSIIINNFGKEKTEYFLNYFSKIYSSVCRLRTMERLGVIDANFH